MDFQTADNAFLRAKDQRKKTNLKDVFLNIITLGGYNWSKNYKRAGILYERFIRAADTDGDGFVSLADQERYLSEHEIELDTITLSDGTRVVRNSVFGGSDPAGKYLNAHPSVKRELDNLEKKLFSEEEK